MNVIPAIDLRDNGVVRLEQGDFAREIRYPADPVALARRYQAAGAGLLHVVDLDAARAGGRHNLAIIRLICKALAIPVQTGGGVRDREGLETRLEAGAARVVVGSLCVDEPDRICCWLESGLRDILVASLDVKAGPGGAWIPQSAGWTSKGGRDLFSLLEQLHAAGLKHLLCTDIERDGMFSGPAVELYRTIRVRYPALEIQASGGIGREDDLEPLVRTGVAGCIVGRALLEGKVEHAAIGEWSR